MSMCWVVTGERGDYSERSTWVVEAWTERAKAERRVEVLTTASRVLAAAFLCNPAFDLNPRDDDEENTKFNKALKARGRARDTAKKEFGDPEMDEDNRYTCVEVRLNKGRLA